jgi:hypothetical protein
MCCFSAEVEKVEKTNIFAALVAPKTQITVYSNKVTLAGDGSHGPFADFSSPFSVGYPRYQPTYDNFKGSSYIGAIGANGSMGSMGTFGAMGHNGNMAPAPLWWEQNVDHTNININNTNNFTYPTVHQSNGQPVAMILAVPIPTGSADNIKMIDMTKERDFFKILKDTMPVHSFRSFDARGMSSLSESYGTKEALQVRRCGPYRYSIIPDVHSFNRLRQDVYKVSDRIFPVLREHYPRGYAFLVCIIDKSAEFSPIAYIHPSDGKRLFIPTLHEHGHPGEEVATNDWDHAIYTIDGDAGTRLTDKRPVGAEVDHAMSKPFLTGFPYKNLNWTKLKRRKIKGYNPNGDILITA